MMDFDSLPLVSVVIPTFNSAKLLLQALNSVFKQTYINYEIVVVDDGSTDRTKQVIEPYRSHINYIYQENQGVAAARNRGIEAARGELIAFLDADDLFLPYKLQQQVTILEAQPEAGMVVGGWHLTDEGGTIIRDVELWHSLPQLDLYTWLYWKPVLPSATLVRRDLLQRVGGFSTETIPVEDVECFLNLVLNGCKAVWCPQIVTIYRQVNPNSLCRHVSKRVESLKLLHQRFFALTNLPDEIKREENKVNYCNLVWSAWYLYRNGYGGEMCDYLLQSLSYTDRSAGEIALNWIESFENYYDEIGESLNTYRLTQTPGWQELIIETLNTRQPQVSVIIPAYNCAKYLPEAIASVLAQTYTNYEIIVVNDGSTDNTREVITPFLDRVRYFEQANQGVSATRNRGLYLARGELIAFLDADDIFLPQKLEHQTAILITQPEIAIVNSGYQIITESGEELTTVERWHTIPELTPEIWLLHKPVLPSAMMIRKENALDVGGFDPRFFASEDVDLVLRMVAKGCKSAWLEEVTVYYRQHQSSASWRNPIRQMVNAELMQECFFERSDLPESLRKLERQSKYDFLVWIACVLYQAGCIDETIAYLKKSLKYTPYSWSETIAQWINSFENSAELNARPFDGYALSKLPQWQQLILSLRISQIFNEYSAKTTEYQTLSTAKPLSGKNDLYDEVYFQLGQKLVAENNLPQAEIWLRKAIALSPKNYRYHYQLADILVKKYDLDNAIVSYRRAIRLNPEDRSWQTELKAALKLQQHWQQLTAYCQQLIDNPVDDGTLKMLMIFPYPPYPPQKGGAAIRMFEQIKYFGKRHHLTVIAFAFDETIDATERELSQYCDRAFIFKLGKPTEPYEGQRQRQLYNFTTWNMEKALGQLSQVDFDVVSFDFIVSSVYQGLFAGHFTVLNEHNIESDLLKRCALADRDNLIPTIATELDAAKVFLDGERESTLLREYERRTWSKFPLRTTVSQENKQEIDRHCDRGKTIVVKNGIDVANIQPVADPDSRKILFMGTMSYYPNIDAVLYFVESILPILLRDNPHISCCIAGREPPQMIKNLAKEYSQIKILADPEDMSAVAAQCSLSFVPLRSGSGTRIKILHSLALGLPVVSTSMGCEGLETIDRQHLLIGDRPHDFAGAILELMTDRQLWHRLQTNGRQLVEKQYDWSAIFAEYERELIGERGTVNIKH